MAAELAKDIKSEKDHGALTLKLIKLTVETASNAEMDELSAMQSTTQQGKAAAITSTARAPNA